MEISKKVKNGLKRCLRLHEEEYECDGCPYEKCGCSEALMDDVQQLIDAPAKYTAADVIDIVQHAVGDELCDMSAENAEVGYKIERKIIAKIVENERKAED